MREDMFPGLNSWKADNGYERVVLTCEMISANSHPVYMMRRDF